MRMLAAQPAAVSGLALLTIVLVTSIALVISLAWAARRLTRQGRPPAGSPAGARPSDRAYAARTA